MARKRFAPRPEPVRDLRGTDADRTFLQPAALRAWVASLPVAHPQRTAESLLEALATINDHRMPARRLRRLLAALEPATERTARLVAASGADGGSATLPANGASTTALKLREELVRGYRLLQRIAGPGGRRFRHASGRILHHTGAVLEQCHGSHAEPPPGLWHLLHSQARSAPRGQRNRRYQAVLLAAACNPWGLRREQIPVLYAYSRRWAGALRIAARASGYGDIAFMPRADAGPFPVAAGQTSPEGTVFLNPGRVLKYVERERRRMARRGAAADNTASLVLERLASQLPRARPRRYPRRRARGRVTVVSGLSSIHRTLTGGSEAADPRAVFDGHALNGGEARGEDVWNLILPSAELTQNLGDTGPQARRPPLPEPPPESDWALRDRSPDGYRLAHPGEEVDGVRVGRLLLLAEAGRGQNPSLWELGVVRWLRHHRTGDVEVGVSIIAPRVTGLTLTAETPGGARTPAFGGLLTAAVPRLGIQENLVMPSLHIDEGRPVWQQTDSGELPLQLISCADREIDFTRYQIQRVGF
ncbi:MAG: hypothetical protein R6V11_02760 [Ectothiorhodospiraceae bacterium]